jgi:hypothetical protein
VQETDPFNKATWAPELRDASTFWGPHAQGKVWVHNITSWLFEDVVSAIAEHGIEGAVIDYDMTDWDRPIAVLIWPAKEEE